MTEHSHSYPDIGALDCLEFMPLALLPVADATHDDGEHQVIDAETAYVFKIMGSRERAERIVATLNAAASLAARHSRPVAQTASWQPIETCPKAEGALYFLFNELWEIEGWKNVERAEWFQGAWLFESGLMLADCDAKFNPTMWHPDTTPAEPVASLCTCGGTPDQPSDHHDISCPKALDEASPCAVSSTGCK